jgi:hypothetical protein
MAGRSAVSNLKIYMKNWAEETENVTRTRRRCSQPRHRFHLSCDVASVAPKHMCSPAATPLAYKSDGMSWDGALCTAELPRGPLLCNNALRKHPHILLSPSLELLFSLRATKSPGVERCYRGGYIPASSTLALSLAPEQPSGWAAAFK